MRSHWKVSLARVLAFIAVLTFGFMPAAARSAPTSSTITPNAVNTLDCNGYSPTYVSLSSALKRLCTDPVARDADGSAYRFLDNGHYVGHDEPSVKFVSTAPGSGNQMTYLMQLAKDPPGTPTTSPTGATTSDYAELSPAPWFGLPLCEPNSYPQNPCTPDSDSNTGTGLATDAGSAFLEVQFYPPGYGPFFDSISCDATRYCASLHINSLECTLNFATCNNNCIEPTNFAFIQTDGVPTGPPSPQLSNVNTATPNGKTLFMNPGDALKVTLEDTSDGLKVDILDMTTGRHGFMVASAANGYATTHIADCSGTPFDFHAEYSSASQQNQVPWAALEGGVLMEDEIGHFEPCSSVTHQLPISAGPSFSDPNVFQTCVGGIEKGGTGEGPCSLTTGVCTNATTETGAACPTNNFTSGANCEFSDALCMPAGPRTVTTNGVAQTVSQPVAGCAQDAFQNGDLDFDGSSYIADWPDGSSTHPTPFNYVGPFDAHGKPYPQIQIETDLPASEILCDVVTGAGCTVPPAGAAFYPFWTLARFSASQLPIGIPDRGGQCVWSFGNTIAHQTTNSMGGAAEYGAPDVARFAGTAISPLLANPALDKKNC